MYSVRQRKNKWSAARAVELTQRLVRVPSDWLHEERVAETVEKEMRASRFDKVLRDSVGNVVSVKFGREETPTVLLASHMDTVGVGNESAWSLPAYEGVVMYGQLYGRGAADCKSGLAAQLYAGDLLVRSRLPLRGTLIVAVTVADGMAAVSAYRHC